MASGTIWNGFRCALAMFSGNSILNFGIAERLRAFRYSFFTSGVVMDNGSCSAASYGSAALWAFSAIATQNKKPSLLHFCINDGFVLERPTRLELATSTLARWRSTR